MNKKNVFSGWLFASLFLAVGMICARIVYTGDIVFGFLIWNLFLAFLPYLFAMLLVNSERKKSKYQYLWIGLWLLFFPNAPYIITDLFHLQEREPVPLWYDTAMLFFTAWNGLLLGILSMMKVESFLTRKFGRRISFLLVSFCFFACGFGIYAGRFLRWNSWDLLISPKELITDLAPRIVHPTHHYGTWGMTLLFGLFPALIYFTLKRLTNFKS
jgi:uncharacterized membrane protein